MAATKREVTRAIVHFDPYQSQEWQQSKYTQPDQGMTRHRVESSRKPGAHMFQQGHQDHHTISHRNGFRNGYACESCDDCENDGADDAADGRVSFLDTQSDDDVFRRRKHRTGRMRSPGQRNKVQSNLITDMRQTERSSINAYEKSFDVRETHSLNHAHGDKKPKPTPRTRPNAKHRQSPVRSVTEPCRNKPMPDKEWDTLPSQFSTLSINNVKYQSYIGESFDGFDLDDEDIFATINNVSAFVPQGSKGGVVDMAKFNNAQDEKENQNTNWQGVMTDLFYNLDNVDLGRYSRK